MSDIPWEMILGTIVTSSSALASGIVISTKKVIAHQEQASAHKRDMEKLRHEWNLKLTETLIEATTTLKDVQVIQANVASALTLTTSRLTNLVGDMTRVDPDRYTALENKWAGDLLAAVRDVGEQVQAMGRDMREDHRSLMTAASIKSQAKGVK